MLLRNIKKSANIHYLLSIIKLVWMLETSVYLLSLFIISCLFMLRDQESLEKNEKRIILTVCNEDVVAFSYSIFVL